MSKHFFLKAITTSVSLSSEKPVTIIIRDLVLHHSDPLFRTEDLRLNCAEDGYLIQGHTFFPRQPVSNDCLMWAYERQAPLLNLGQLRRAITDSELS